MRRLPFVAVLLAFVVAPIVRADEPDPYLWLEDVDGAKAMAWVKEQSAITVKELQANKVYRPIYDKTLEIFDSKDKIPSPTIMGKYLYNFWQDNEHERGIWRRTDFASYKTKTPAWETVIDLDALSKADHETWVFKGASCLPPEYKRCMVALSRGGGDATVDREFDTVSKSFVDGGFSLKEAKSSVSFRDIDTLWVGTDFGPGTMTSSGYARQVRLWKRGTPLADAKLVYETSADYVQAAGGSAFTAEGRYDYIFDVKTFFTSRVYLMLGDRLVHVPIPDDAEFRTLLHDRIVFSLRNDWKVGSTTYKQGSLLAAKLDDMLRETNQYSVLFEPSAKVSLGAVGNTRDVLLYTTLDNVRGRFYRVTLDNDAWKSEEIPLPGQGTVSIEATSDDSPTFFYAYQDFLTPSSLYVSDGGAGEKVKSLPTYFDATGMSVTQHEATSKDGTKIPYFLVTPKGFKADGKTPTLVYAYGGFESAQVPTYSGVLGNAWLARGGVYVLANIRGGGEFGPAWHLAATKQNRIKTHEDLVAVAEDVVAQGITTKRHLGVMGGSNGGLLVATAFTLRPDLFHAVVCQVPLIDMRRYSHLLAGASWMSEYGDPDKPEDWAYIKTWSPYELVKKGVDYPRVFFWTTTRDDRVHPAHARKIAAKMIDQGHPILYFENVEGGHGTGAVSRQKALTVALQYSYLWETLP